MEAAAFLGLVRQARSYRRFKESDPIPADLVRSLVDLARIVPSAANLQPLRYRLVTTAEECAKVFPLTKWAGALREWSGPQPGERPTGYIAICTDKARPSPTDVGIAAYAIQLGAAAAGYGACMLGAIDRPRLVLALAIPDAYDIHLLIALGRPGETIVLEDLAPTAANTNYYRTADNIHHVPKRRLKDVLL